MDNNQLAEQLLNMAKMILGPPTEISEEDEVIVSSRIIESAEDDVVSLLSSMETYKKLAISSLQMNQYSRAFGYMKEIIDLKTQLSKARGSVSDAIFAYGDLHGFKDRDLNWKGQFLNANEVSKVMKRAVPDGYGSFDANKVSNAVNKFSGYKYSFGRDYSPVLYIKGVKTKKELKKLVSVFLNITHPNELSMEVGSKTVWVDGSRDKDIWDKIQDKLPRNEIRVWWK